jgi:alkylhydroperoxidase family enzyme
MIGKRLAIRSLEALCRMMWGFPPTIITLIVEHMGPMRALGWFAGNMPRFLATRVVLGPVRVHLACIVVSLRNGCAYCAYGHAYALELLYLRQHGKLFPLDAKALDEWYGLNPRTLRNRLRNVLTTAGLHTEAIWVDRMVALADGSQAPVDAAEARLAHVIRMADTASRIAVARDAAPDEAHDPVNKDAVVKARHAELRAATSI